MEVETKYIAPRTPAFVALMQTPELAGYHLEPMPAVRVQDVYLDTALGDLLRQGYVFRVREQDDEVLATLKSLGGAEGALHKRLELEAALGGPIRGGRLPIIPEGQLRQLLDELIGQSPLEELTRLRQHRTPRVAFDGARLVGVLSLDVVAHEADGTLHVTNEVEVELAETGRVDDLYRLDPVLRQWGLEPTARSKFERALLRQPRRSSQPLLLLPDERTALEAYQESGMPLHRRRARVILLAARGLRAGTIANKVGLSEARVSHWMQAFQSQRLGIFEVASEREEARLLRRAPRYRVSELVSSGAETAAPIFSHDHVTFEAPSLAEAHDDAGSPVWLERALGGLGSVETQRTVRIREEDIESTQIPPEALPFLSVATGGDGQGLPPTPMEETTATALDHPDLFDASRGAMSPPTHASEEEPGVDSVVADPMSAAPPRTQVRVEDIDSSTVSAAPSPPASRAARRIARRPVLQADEPVLTAAERVLQYQHAQLLEATERMRHEREAASVRRVLLAAHRIRIALELFTDYLPPRAVRRLHQGLRGTARALDALGDLDLVLAHLGAAQAEAASEERRAFAPVLDALTQQRAAAFEALLVRLDGALHTQWLDRFERLLTLLQTQVEAGLAVGDHLRELPDDYLDDEIVRPQRAQIHHMLGSVLWDRYEALRAYDALVARDPSVSLYPLGVACASLQFALGLAAGCSEADVHTASEPLGEVESHLMLLHHARVAADALQPYADVAPIVALRRRLVDLSTHAQEEVPAQWVHVAGNAYRQALGRIVAAI